MAASKTRSLNPASRSSMMESLTEATSLETVKTPIERALMQMTTQRRKSATMVENTGATILQMTSMATSVEEGSAVTVTATWTRTKPQGDTIRDINARVDWRVG